MNRECMHVMNESVSRSQAEYSARDMATDNVDGRLSELRLDDACEDRSKDNALVAELIVCSSKRSNGIVVDEKAKAVESEEDAYPVQVDDKNSLVVQHLADDGVGAKISVEDQCHGSMCSTAYDEEATNPLVMCEHTQNRRVVCQEEWIRRESDQNVADPHGYRAKDSQLDSQLQMARVE